MNRTLKSGHIARSPIWSCFIDLEFKKSQHTVQCRVCSAKLLPLCGSNHELWQHVKQNHPEQYNLLFLLKSNKTHLLSNN